MTSADLTGRAGGYRGVAIRCPGCAESMRQLSLAEAEVDVCDACGGLWVDWFDGEVRAVAAETRSSLGSSSGGTREQEKAIRSEAVAIGACPRCTRQLVSERYTVTAEVASSRVEGRTSLVGAATGAELLRCEECMGAFVSRSSADILSWLSSHDEPPPSQSVAKLRPMPWAWFTNVLKGLFSKSS